MMSHLRYCLLMLLITSLTACITSNSRRDDPYRNVDRSKDVLIGELIPIYVSATSDLADVTTEDLIKTYQGVLPYVDDPEVMAQISARIADLQLIYQEQLAAKSEDEGKEIYLPDYTVAIAAYLDVLARYPEREGNDAVYYQLAKAYDLAGRGAESLAALTQLVEKYPGSAFFVEAQFRRGDYLYSQGQYRLAQDAYQAVLDKGQATPFYENAVYMHGWSLFKRNFYEPSLKSFAIVLDRSMPSNGMIEGVAPTKLALVEDSLRIMSIIFSYLDGADSIAVLTQEIGPRAYDGLLYERLGDLYVSQERYRDAIKTFQAYAAIQPMSDKAPELHIKALNAMLVAKFYNEAFAEKESFIEKYNMQSDYYKNAASADRREYIQQFLYVYLDEVARFYHARAQKEKKALARYKVPPKGKLEEMEKDYRRATVFYQRYIDSFPEDVHVAEKSFMMGEALSEIGDYQNAIRFYERAAYDYPVNSFSEDAAYASVLAYRKLLKGEADKDKRAQLIQQKMAAQIAFVDTYGFSKYSRPVLLDTIDMLYSEKQFDNAVKQSERFLALEPAGTPDEQLIVTLVLAHSYFELKNYQAAEVAYGKVLAQLAKKDKRYAEVVDRIAASIYKQGEALVEQDKKLEAVEQFLRVAQVAPNSQHRKNADYDAATYLLQAEQWERAIEVVNAYRDRYDPKHTSLDITSKLILAYEGLERYVDAAKELARLSQISSDPEQQRQALYMSAEYYEKAGVNDKALAMFREYSHKYPEPFDLAMETRFRLSEMYRKMGDDYRRRYWLDKLIKYDREAGDQRTERSKYLAAYARNIFAEDYRLAFEKIKLTLPLRKSLAEKKTALAAALKRYETILDYGVQEFSTQATYYVGSIYSQLSKDLMASERPKGLNELELEQYDILLEEQALPFEDSAIEVHEGNVQNSWNGSYDKWVGRSMQALAKLLPGRYNKQEERGKYNDVIY